MPYSQAIGKCFHEEVDVQAGQSEGDSPKIKETPCSQPSRCPSGSASPCPLGASSARHDEGLAAYITYRRAALSEEAQDFALEHVGNYPQIAVFDTTNMH